MTTTARSPAMGMNKSDIDVFIPNAGFALFKREPGDTMAGRIHLVDKGDDDRRKEVTVAVVVRLGPEDRVGKKNSAVPWSLKVGDRVMLDAWAGHDIEVAETGERFVLTGENDVLGVLEGQ